MHVWALLPAAGSGKRFGSSTPKQFLLLGERTVLEHSMDALLCHPCVQGAMLALHPHWLDQPLSSMHEKPVLRVAGGSERASSVLAGVQALPAECDWVLVHDAARPCLPRADLNRLIEARKRFAQGAILAAPVRDTMKRANAKGCIEQTVDRNQLWHALTPQFFPRADLQRALEHALASGRPVTDEASAMEWQGLQPGLVEGSHRNIKITHADDLPLAACFLENS